MAGVRAPLTALMSDPVETAWRRLALAIVVQAHRDAHDRGLPAYRRQLAMAFLDSRECRQWLDAWTGCQVEPGWWQRRRRG